MKKLLMSVLGLMIVFGVVSVLSANDDPKPPKGKIEEITKDMTSDQRKQFDQYRKAEKDAIKAYKDSKTDENAQKLKDAIRDRIEFVNQITKRDSGNIDEMVEKQFKKITEGSSRPDKKGDKEKKQ